MTTTVLPTTNLNQAEIDLIQNITRTVLNSCAYPLIDDMVIAPFQHYDLITWEPQMTLNVFITVLANSKGVEDLEWQLNELINACQGDAVIRMIDVEQRVQLQHCMISPMTKKSNN